MIAIIYSPCPSEELAKEIGTKLLEEGLAACINILPGMRSLYRWEGNLCDEKEWLMLAKAPADKAQELQARVAVLHPYECPCVLTLPVTDAHSPFTQWVIDETA